MIQPKKTPQRMCIVCKQMYPKKQLLRIVKNQQGEISIDLTGKLAGRGAYICNSLECVEKCAKTKALNRAFECQIPNEVYDKIKGQFIELPK